MINTKDNWTLKCLWLVQSSFTFSLRISSEFFRDFLLKFERFLNNISYNDFESYLTPLSILKTKTSTCSINFSLSLRISKDFFRDFLLKFERFLIDIAYNDFESYQIFFLF